LNVPWSAADHQFRLFSDGEDLSLALVAYDCDHRGASAVNYNHK
jgi:hypothetical protein